MLLQPDNLLQNGRYRILRRIGQGGMGAVYEALDTRLNHRVAVKQALVDTEALGLAFEREAQRLARLHHPALPNVTDHFMENGGQFLVMRFIDGADLAEQLEQRGSPFQTEQILVWADRLLDALTYLHSQDPPLIHRDIKPANLKLTKQGEIILLDFGLAKGGLPNPTAAGTMPGYTLGYASYEQMVGQTTDARSDVYGLAATLYTLLTNHVPPNSIVRMSEQFNGGRDPLLPANEINPKIPLYVVDVLSEALSLHPEKRPPSAQVMRAMLKGPPPVLKNSPVPPPTPVEFAPPTVRRDVPVVGQNTSPATRINPNLSPSSLPRQARGGTAPLPQDSYQPPPKAPPSRYEEEKEDDSSGSWKILALLLGLLILLIMCGAGYFFANRGGTGEEPVIVNMPTFTVIPFTSTPTIDNPDEPTETIPTETEIPIIPEEASPTSTQEPTATEEPTITATEEAISTPTTEASPTSTENITATPNPFARTGNGPDLRAARRTFDVRLDGIISEWDSASPTNIDGFIFQQENWSGPEDLSGEVYATWDEQFLYLAVRVADDTIVQESQDQLLHRGDAIEFFMDLDLVSDFTQNSYNNDDVQLVISPGDFLETDPSSWVHSSPTGNFRNQIALGALLSREGYEIEARIPWSRLAIQPQVGQLYGYAVALSDDDSIGTGEQETQLSTSLRKPYPNPINWGNLYLDP